MKPGAEPHDVARPAWKGTYPMTVRIFPNFNYDDPSVFDPTRLDTEELSAFSDFGRSVPAAICHRHPFLEGNLRAWEWRTRSGRGLIERSIPVV